MGVGILPPGRAPRAVVAGAAFVACLATALAGSDFPPPVGFLWLVPVAAMAATAVYLRMPVYAAWMTVRRPGRLPRALGEGFGFGLAMGLLVASIPGTGDPSVPREAFGPGLAIWLGVTGAVGVLCAGAVYSLTAVFVRGSRP